jgi:hypothetical protein
MKRQMSSAQNNQKEIAELKRQLQAAKAATSNDPSMYAAAQKQDDIQERILQELAYLRNNPEVLAKPGTSHGAELERVRKERDTLIDENRKLKTMINEDSAAPTSGNAKYLKNKVRHS